MSSASQLIETSSFGAGRLDNCRRTGRSFLRSAHFRETILLPLVVCVLLPGMAGAWWRLSHGDSGAAQVTFSTAGAPRIEESAPLACSMAASQSSGTEELEGETRGTVAEAVPPQGR